MHVIYPDFYQLYNKLFDLTKTFLTFNLSCDLMKCFKKVNTARFFDILES